MRSNPCFTKSISKNKSIRRIFHKYANLVNALTQNVFVVERISNGVIYFWKSPEKRLKLTATIPQKIHDLIQTYHKDFPEKQPFIEFLKNLPDFSREDGVFRLKIDPHTSLKEYGKHLHAHMKSIHDKIDLKVIQGTDPHLKLIFENKEALMVYTNLWAFRLAQIKENKQNNSPKLLIK